MIICDMCKNPVSFVKLYEQTNYCETCWYYNRPPILILASLWGMDAFLSDNQGICKFFNPKTDKQIQLPGSQLKKCGFKLFNRKIFFNMEINEKYREIFIYRYSGNVKCLALKEYKLWP